MRRKAMYLKVREDMEGFGWEECCNFFQKQIKGFHYFNKVCLTEEGNGDTGRKIQRSRQVGRTTILRVKSTS